MHYLNNNSFNSLNRKMQGTEGMLKATIKDMDNMENDKNNDKKDG